MQNFRNYYEILGVNRDTPGAEIKRAYRQLARKYHPDVNQGNVEAENRFKEINEAYEVLSDSERRAQYDKFGSFWKQQGFQNGQKRPWGWGGKPEEAAPPAEDDINFGEFRDFNTFVDELLRGRQAAAKQSTDWLDNPIPPRRQAPEPTPMSSAPADSYSGNYGDDRAANAGYDASGGTAGDDWENTTPKQRSDDWGGSEPVPPSPTSAADDRRQQFTAQPRPRPDESQRSTERPPNRQPQRDTQREQYEQPPGQRDQSRPRDQYRNQPPRQERPSANAPLPRDVEAQLMIPLEKAYTGGRERIRLEDGRMIEVNLPKAIISGQKLRLKGQGIAGGNLFLQIDVAPHKFYKLNGLDLMTKVPVTPVEAVLAAPIEVPTIDGLVKMNLPKNLKSGQKLRLGKRGYPAAEGDRRGDQIVELVIQMPSELSDAEKDLYEKLKQTETNPRANLA